MKIHIKYKLLFLSSFFFVVACQSTTKKNNIEHIPIDKNTAKMLSVGDTIKNNIIALKVCFTDSICGIFALDNGLIDRFVFDSVFFDRIYPYYSLKEGSDFFSKAGRKQIKEYEGEMDIDLCNQKISTKKIMVISGFSQQNGNLDGLIGSDFFVDNIVEINYDNGTVSFLDSVAEKTKGYSAIPLLKRESFPNCKDLYVSLPKIGKQRIHFDLGYFGGLRLPYSTWDALYLDTNKCIGKGLCLSLHNPPETAYFSTLDSMYIGNLMVKNPSIVTQITETPYERFDMLDWESNYRGVLGQEFFSQYNMIIDYQKDTLYFKKRGK